MRNIVISVTMTILVVASLLAIGPVNAISAAQKSYDDVNIGEHDVATFDVEFVATDVEDVKLVISANGFDDSVCQFDERGKEIICDKAFLNIKPLHDKKDIGYGYGYENEYRYRVKWRAPYVSEDEVFSVEMSVDGNAQGEVEKISVANDDKKKK